MSERPPPESRNHHAFNQHAAHHHGPGHSKKPCSRIKLYNLGYFFSLSGLMALCEIVSSMQLELLPDGVRCQILGMTIYALLWDSSNELDKFLVTVSFLQWMTGLYIHATIAFCAAGARIRSLLLYLLHHGVGAILYLGGAVTTLVSSMYTQSDDIIRTASSLALAASALHLVQATRYLLKQRPEGDRGDVGEDVTAGILVETRIARFKSSRATPVPAPAVPIRRESIAVPVRRESTVIPSRRESTAVYPEYL
ncbi:uncharacterized protein LOC121833785 [Ixodes scapularis]|uniref:uncharacterized protein LOC121833785 n=1 Tax=Ixodes scapularis TaxID=6945 RepID=UPI001C37F5FC|nr:uncharacterized protein LOC121833785 [Ixodes scapularis]